MVKPVPLPFDALPLSFTLFSSLSPSTFSSPLPCLTASLPFRSHPDDAQRARTEPPGERPSVQIVRILDPEHREPFVSLARIFVACALSPLEGLVRFALRKPAYDSSLGGLAPFADIWVPLPEARRVASELNVLDELAALLEWETRAAWSVEDKEEGGIVHNWKIASDKIDPSRYSTEAMLSTRFPRLHLLPAQTRVRTLTSPLPTSPAPPSPTSFPTLFSHMVSWTILEYEDFLSSQEDAPPMPRSPANLAPNLTLTSLSTTLFSLLSLLKLVPPSSLPTNETRGSAVLLGGKIRVERSHVRLGEARAKVALVDALGKLVGREWRIEVESNIGAATAAGTGEVWVNGREEHLRGGDSDRRWDNEVDQRLQTVEAALASASGRLTEDCDDKYVELSERVDEVERRQRRADRGSRARVEQMMEAPIGERWMVGTLNLVLVGIIAVLLVPYVKPFF